MKPSLRPAPRGALLIDAYESAGFVRHRVHCSRLALKDEVAERIAELRALQTDMDDVSLMGLLASLRRIIKAGESSENPTLVNAARLALLDASRLQVALGEKQAYERRHLDKVFNDMTAEAAAEAASKPAPEPVAQRPSPPSQAPAAAPSAPRQRPSIAPGAPAHLLASAATSPLKLPGLSSVPSHGMAARRWT